MRAGGRRSYIQDMATRVLIAGGGVAALEAALALRDLAGERVRVELVAPEPRFWYRPVSVAEPFGLGEVRHFDLSELASSAGATFSPGALVGVDARARLAHLSTGGSVGCDVLLVAAGAAPVEAVPGALTFRGPADTDRMQRLLGEIAAGRVGQLAFAVPWGAVWALPLYELALMTAAYASDRERNLQVTLVTPEQHPLDLFGAEASAAVRRLLDERGVAVWTDGYPLEVTGGELRLADGEAIAADRVVALPRLRGPRIDGIPQTVEGFVPVDEHCRVDGLDDVFAAGDITTFAVKQGGIATQQADAAASTIAAATGAAVTPQPFRPVLRGLLLTGREPRYLRHELASGGDGAASIAGEQPLWWPPAKIVGRYLAPFLGELAGTGAVAEPPAPDAVPVEVELDPEPARRAWPVAASDEGGPTAGDAMSRDALVVAAEDTLGEVAEQMRRLDAGSAVVAVYGRTIGILTSRDLLRAFAGRAHPSEARVREWMTAEPVTVSPGTPLATAVTLMTEYGFHHLPVVEDDRAVGMLGLRQAARPLGSRPGIGLGF
jgi:sulfide:quinone oxidoreductase